MLTGLPSRSPTALHFRPCTACRPKIVVHGHCLLAWKGGNSGSSDAFAIMKTSWLATLPASSDDLGAACQPDTRPQL